ncbi:DUF6933 domain-containing protein [Zobellella maritima]|uniref:DUF6933 domain-containing protein n=1 Tax=Zobellella maritima TaxID=2059725 RepID=UPI000E2FF7F2|nr:hypothetical protein [Zobellella maritima]
MLVFNCTKAAAQLFSCIRKGVSRSPVEAPPGPSYADDGRLLSTPDGQPACLSQWLVHAVKVKGQNCLIAMELNNRYCMTFTGLRKGGSEAFVSLFIERLLNNMQWYGEDLALLDETSFQPIATRFQARHDEVRFFARSDRSAQAHINEVVWQLRDQVDYAGCLPDNQHQAAYFDLCMNDQLRSTQDHADYFYPYQAMFCHWLAEYCGAGPRQLEQAAAGFRELRLHGGEQPPPEIKIREILPASESVLPDKVVSLAAFRQDKS